MSQDIPQLLERQCIREMLACLDPLREFNFGSHVLRLLLALVSGGVIGYGRSKKECAAGLRTNILISLGAALAITITLYEYQNARHRLRGRGVSMQMGPRLCPPRARGAFSRIS